MRRGWLALVAVVSVLSSAGARADENLVSNGSFDSGADGWRNQAAGVEGVVSEWLAEGGRSGGGLHVRATREGDDAVFIWRYVVKPAPAGRKVRFGGWVRGKRVKQLAALCLRAQAGDGKLVGFATTASVRPLAGDFEWTRVEQVLAVPDGAAELHLLAFISGSGEAWFDDISMSDAGAASAVEIAAARAGGAGAAPGLFRLRGEYRVTTTLATETKPTLLFPVPIDYREQAPLSYRIEVEPADRLVSARLYRDKGDNRVVELVLMPPDPERAIEARWSSVVLVGPRSFDGVPKTAALPAEWPEESRGWLKSTRCAQSSAKRIREVAGEIRGESRDVMAILGATLERARKIYAGQAGRATSLDAVEALERQGSCTSCANLVAALIRANGIPARILAGYPTWSGPLQTHYIVEAYVPGYGWYPIESTQLEAPWPPQGQIQVSIIPPEYEDRCGLRPAAAAGVPYLSLTEYKHGLGTIVVTGAVEPSRNVDHVAEPFGSLNASGASPEAWARVQSAARGRWTKWIESGPSATIGQTLASPLAESALAAAADLAALERVLGE